MNNDEDLKAFFDDLRLQDKQETPPPFPELPAHKAGSLRRLTWPLTAAAAALLLLLIGWPEPSDTSTPTDTAVLVITLEAEVTTQTKTLLDTPKSIYSWESPSASLIADF
ncbi:MAG: hypothetical protein ACJATN_000071 [Neolewinella sp.]|jgi:hypothetical protein